MSTKCCKWCSMNCLQDNGVVVTTLAQAVAFCVVCMVLKSAIKCCIRQALC